MTQRVQPGYEPPGIRAGSWMISPSITTGTLFDSNVFSTSTGAQSDIAATIQPSVRAHTLWERNGVDLQFQSQSYLYLNHPGLDQTDVGVRGTGWIDVSHDAQILTSYQAQHLHEGVGTLSSPAGAVAPTPYDLLSSDVTYRQEFNRLSASIGTRVDSYSFGTTQAQNGSLIDQSNRDGQIYKVHSRVDYTLSPKFDLFTSAEGNHRELRGTPENPLDSSGYRLLSGTDIELTHLITGEFAAGYASQRFADVTVGTVAGPTYRALLRWSPTRLFDLHFKAERVVTESAETTSSGVRADGVELGADYELRRNLIFSLTGAYELEKFFAQTRTDRVTSEGARLKYLLSQYNYMSLEYRFIQRDSDIPTNSFDKHQVLFNVTSQF
ncbi:MAG TPA: outer membrane beta-barrel protein [Xanthobacteraceae bacterium]